MYACIHVECINGRSPALNENEWVEKRGSKREGEQASEKESERGGERIQNGTFGWCLFVSRCVRAKFISIKGYLNRVESQHNNMDWRGCQVCSQQNTYAQYKTIQMKNQEERECCIAIYHISLCRHKLIHRHLFRNHIIINNHFKRLKTSVKANKTKCCMVLLPLLPLLLLLKNN